MTKIDWAFVFAWIVCLLAGLAFWGVVVWAVIKLVSWVTAQ